MKDKCNEMKAETVSIKKQVWHSPTLCKKLGGCANKGKRKELSSLTEWSVGSNIRKWSDDSNMSIKKSKSIPNKLMRNGFI